MWLTHDPEYPENLPAAPLVRYGWTPRGELAVVYDRSAGLSYTYQYEKDRITITDSLNRREVLFCQRQ
ncbi:YD repeat-containing protein [Shigella sonnei]|nr:YD repeat-containing protein [Shigella sonnei]SJG00297.1 YD repeat-containing protein [Shigella sonnei]